MKQVVNRRPSPHRVPVLQSIKTGRQVVKAASEALSVLARELGSEFEGVVSLLSSCKGRVILSGIGKSGHISRKISSTLSSTGTPSLFLHPSEASHGDLGMISSEDLVVCISKSGESKELADIVSHCHRRGVGLVAITAKANSTLARASDHVLLIPDLPEAGPLSVAPTTSTSCMLALGDALALATLEARGFAISTFHELHPGGKLGQALTRVDQIMSTGSQMPTVPAGTSVGDAILEMTRCRFGCAGVLDSQGRLVGIFTDGDLRRRLSPELLTLSIETVMTPQPRTISPDDLVADVVRVLRSKRIPSVFVTDSQVPVGIVHIHDILGRDLV
jgi:arabinose-5-phosphate isomerase